MMLTEFLLARIAEDEAGNGCPGEGEYSAWRRSDRIERECEAKRRIVGEHPASTEWDEGINACTTCQWDIDCDAPKHDHQPGAGPFPCPTLRLLALPYADHPDYQQEWAV